MFNQSEKWSKIQYCFRQRCCQPICCEVAEPLYRRALAIDEKALGPDHPDVANSNFKAFLVTQFHRISDQKEFFNTHA
jgi:hypothetical protein